jgi:glycopeptide antibiotics resistance protein
VALGVCVVLVVLVVLARTDCARARPWARALVGVSVAVILGLTMVGGSTARASSNLVPGRTIIAELSTPGHPLGLLNVVGNVAMFVPFGWLLALAIARRPLVVAVVAGAGLSVSIEVAQSLIGRVSDVDDVILNSSGAAAGACVALLLRSATRERAAHS